MALVRRTAETLTFLVKQIALLERRPELRGGGASEHWPEAARRAAEALAKLWERNKQLGQFVDIESGELIVGGSTSGGLAPAGLALAAAQLKEPRYLQVARAIGEHYYDRFVRVGLTCGGPGDVLQAPDSQSAAALLDSFVTLYEATRDRVWIDRARAASHLLGSWVIARDAPGAGSGCGGSGVRATGAVFWSAGSGHGSPGYVLSSGDALLRLYRATGDVTLLELLRDTVHNLAQYLPDTDERKPASGDDATCSRADPGRWLAPGDSVVPADGVQNCADKGADAVEPDDIDGYTNNPGFPFTRADQVAYNKAIAGIVHSFGLAVALKNDGDDVGSLLPFFDFAIVEQCVQYKECGIYSPFVATGKSVLVAEYQGNITSICSQLGALKMNGILTNLDLTGQINSCH